jgi:hypothetical protein
VSNASVKLTAGTPPRVLTYRMIAMSTGGVSSTDESVGE